MTANEKVDTLKGSLKLRTHDRRIDGKKTRDGRWGEGSETPFSE